MNLYRNRPAHCKGHCLLPPLRLCYSLHFVGTEVCQTSTALLQLLGIFLELPPVTFLLTFIQALGIVSGREWAAWRWVGGLEKQRTTSLQWRQQDTAAPPFCRRHSVGKHASETRFLSLKNHYRDNNSIPRLCSHATFHFHFLYLHFILLIINCCLILKEKTKTSIVYSYLKYRIRS